LVPNSLEMSLELSAPIKARLPQLMDAAVAELARISFPLRARGGM